MPAIWPVQKLWFKTSAACKVHHNVHYKWQSFPNINWSSNLDRWNMGLSEESESELEERVLGGLSYTWKTSAEHFGHTLTANGDASLVRSTLRILEMTDITPDLRLNKNSMNSGGWFIEQPPSGMSVSATALLQRHSYLTTSVSKHVATKIKHRTDWMLHHRSSKLSATVVKTIQHHVKLEVFTALTMKNDVFWDVTPSGCCKNRHFGGT
jgi:hypothetical protein